MSEKIKNFFWTTKISRNQAKNSKKQNAENLVAIQNGRILSAVSDVYTIILHTDTHTYLNPLDTSQKSDLPREVAFLHIYIL